MVSSGKRVTVNLNRFIASLFLLPARNKTVNISDSDCPGIFQVKTGKFCTGKFCAPIRPAGMLKNPIFWAAHACLG